MREALRHIYADIFVEHLTKNPLWVAKEPISCTAFVRDLDAYLGSLARGCERVSHDDASIAHSPKSQKGKRAQHAPHTELITYARAVDAGCLHIDENQSSNSSFVSSL
eukprot:scaffold4899_cov135-Isochrysis_galbana.AAC.4